MQEVAARVAVNLISVYQRRVSPYKGFCCAHRVLHAGLSCSEFAKEQLASRGMSMAARALRVRLLECRHAAHVLTLSGGTAPLTTESSNAPDRVKRQGDTCANVCTMPCL
jgi:putative component of membrane protein insertase Oxa1/YidC/SpoIIIJ protein YidD